MIWQSTTSTILFQHDLCLVLFTVEVVVLLLFIFFTVVVVVVGRRAVIERGVRRRRLGFGRVRRLERRFRCRLLLLFRSLTRSTTTTISLLEFVVKVFLLYDFQFENVVILDSDLSSIRWRTRWQLKEVGEKHII